MSWVEVFKINSDMSKPLNVYISELISGLTTLVNTVNTNVTNTKTQVGTVNTTVNTINTTVNTINTKVQSLDKLIEAQTRIVASDDAYATLSGAGSVVAQPVNTEVSYTLPNKLKMTRGGSIRVGGTLGRSNYAKMRGTFIALVNGVEAARFSCGVDSGSNSEDFTIDVPFEAGDVISFKLTGVNTASTTNTRKVSISDLTLTGTVINNVHDVIS